VDASSFAAHAADVGIDLAKSLQAEIAFMHVVDPSVARAAPEIGVPADKLIAIGEQEAKKLLSAFRDRTGARMQMLQTAAFARVPARTRFAQ
jgi:universal stress protein A